MADVSQPAAAETGRPPSLLDACIPAAALIILLATSYLFYGDKAAQGPNQIALLFSGLIACGIAVKNGMSWSGLRQATVDGVASALTAIFILLAVGALIGTCPSATFSPFTLIETLSDPPGRGTTKAVSTSMVTLPAGSFLVARICVRCTMKRLYS